MRQVLLAVNPACPFPCFAWIVHSAMSRRDYR